MAFQVRVADVDITDTQGGRRHNNIKHASSTLTVSGATTGLNFTFTLSPNAPVTFAEGAAWANAASDEENARLIGIAINAEDSSPIRAVFTPGSAVLAIEALFPGGAGESIAVTSSGGAITIPALGRGTGSVTGPQALQDFLDANVPDIGTAVNTRIAGSLDVQPLTTESTLFLIRWEENE